MRSGLLGVALLLTASLAACSGETEGGARLPTLEPKPTPSVLTSPRATGISAPTPAGATQFVRYWFSEITRAYQLRDPEPVARLSAPRCTACARYVASITQAREKQERVEGVSFTLTLVEAQAVVGTSVKVSVIYDGPATHRFDRAGHEVHSEPAVKNFEEELTLVRSGDSWLVQEDAIV